ncbi:hypothetical protein MYX76_13360 [Desulfobacterota bacterium AH_259_B03_O07]|nr:hypothetical protein [Desulfobacterota bacterium AH_259_B03_O07]
MFNFLEEFAAIISEKELKCKNCGFLKDNQEGSDIRDSLICPKCGEKDWEETSFIDEEKI